MRKYRTTGFTLIELMIVVVIVAILAAIAYPSYLAQVRKSHRADAEGDLMGLAAAMERYFTENGRYVDTNGNPPALGSSGIYPNQSPQTGTALYNLAIVKANTSATKYLLTATPVAGTTQADDSCGTLTLDDTGQKGADATNCWSR